MTLLEMTMAITVLVLGVVGSMQAMILLERSQERTKEVGRATQAARRVLEAIQAEAFAEAFRRYNGSTADDPGGAGTAPGANFRVAGLSALPGDADGFPGEVVFPSPTASPLELREDFADSDLGMPRDLNGDTFVDAANHATDYKLLPVQVRVVWRSASGPGVIELNTMLANF